MPIFRPWVYCILLVLFTALLYGLFLNNPIVFDDMPFFLFSGEIQPYFAEFAPWRLRWLPYATLAWSVNILGLSMTWLRVESLVLHCAVGIALFFFIQILYGQITTGYEIDRQNGLPLVWAAFFSALLFLLSPVAVYGVAYLAQRSIVMATLFALLSLIAYIHGLVNGYRKWLWVSVLLYLLAVQSKEHVIMLPAVTIALTALLQRFSIEQVKKLREIYLGFLLVVLLVLLQRVGIFGAVYEPNAPDMLEKIEVKDAFFYSILTQSALFFKYLLLWFVPNTSWMSGDMREPFARSAVSLYGLAAIGFLLYGAVAIKLLLRRGVTGLVGFALLFPWVLFFTEFTVVRIQESFVLYRSYLWMSGVFVALPLLMKKFEARFVATILLFLALILGVLAVDRLVTFKHRFLFWDDAAILAQGKNNVVGMDRIYANRGLINADIMRYPEAIGDLKLAISLRPNFGYYHHSLAVAYIQKGDYKEAVAEFNRSIELAPENMRGYYGLGLAYGQLKKMDLAIENFRVSCEKGLKHGCDKLEKIKNDNPAK